MPPLVVNSTDFLEIPDKISKTIRNSLFNLLSKARTAFTKPNATLDLNHANIFNKALLQPRQIVGDSRGRFGTNQTRRERIFAVSLSLMLQISRAVGNG